MIRLVTCTLVVLISFCGSCLAQVRLIAPEKLPGPGQATRFGVSGIKAAQRKGGTPQTVPFVVYLPSNYTSNKKWPVIMEWHGAGGRAGVQISQRVTRGKDFICVGLTYINMRAATEYPYIDLVYDTVMKQFNGDPSAVFPGGFSAGGLAQERFILSAKTIGKYRAVWMFGAGLVRPKKSTTWLKNTPFFVAVGEKDFNRKPVERMLPQAKKITGEIEFHVMPKMGHTVDLKNYGPKLLAFFKKYLPQKSKLAEASEKSSGKPVAEKK